jgi:hypothetical protein
MTDPSPPADDRLMEAWKAEAMALFTANQRARGIALQMVVATFVVIAAGAMATILADNGDVMLVIAPVTLGLQSLLFQQYADLNVVGAARGVLERRVNQALGTTALLYETAIAPIRKRPPLVTSVRLLQAATAAAVIATVLFSLAVAYDDQSAALSIGFTVLIAVELLSAGLSYRDMLRSVSVASAALSDAIATSRE